MLGDYASDQFLCPKCGDDTYEVSSHTRVKNPKEGQRAVFFVKLACGCSAKQDMVWYDGWV